MQDPRAIDTFYSVRMMFYFSRHSHGPNGSDRDKALTKFLKSNILKSVAICNGYLLMFYFARFKTYRNSYLGYMHLPVTLLALHNGVKSTNPIFHSYLYSNNELPVAILEDPTYSKNVRSRLSLNERNLISDVVSLSYLDDYFINE